MSRQQIIKALIRLCGCTGCSAPLLFAYGKNRFSHNEAHFVGIQGDSNEYPQHYVLWRNKENYP